MADRSSWQESIEIENGAKLEARFGRWPSFQDARVLGLDFDETGPSVLATFHLPVPEAVSVRVELRFEDIDNVQMGKGPGQPVLACLVFERTIAGRTRVIFEDLFGLWLQLDCASVKVSSVRDARHARLAPKPPASERAVRPVPEQTALRA